MAGARIRRVLLRRPNLRYQFQEDFVRRLEGQRVRAVARRAKYLLVELVSGDVLLMHLGMSGSFRVLRSGDLAGPPAAGPAPHDGAVGRVPRSRPGKRSLSRRRYYYDVERLDAHDHVVFEMSTGAVVVFNDPRRFGFMTLLTAAERDTHQTLGKLGPEPLARAFDAAALARILTGRRTSLKIALLDQRLIAGLGNIYVSEALHRAGLSPKRRASTLVTRSGEPRPEVGRLVVGIRDVLKQAIRNQYRTGADNPFLVYDRDGEPCQRPGCTGTIRRIVQGGRSTFFCPVCQR